MLTGPVHVHVWSTRTTLPAGGGSGGAGGWRAVVAAEAGAAVAVEAAEAEEAGHGRDAALRRGAARRAARSSRRCGRRRWRGEHRSSPCCMRRTSPAFALAGVAGPTRRDVEADGRPGRHGVGPRAAVPEEPDHERAAGRGPSRRGRGCGRRSGATAPLTASTGRRGVDAPVGEDAADGARLGRRAATSRCAARLPSRRGGRSPASGRARPGLCTSRAARASSPRGARCGRSRPRGSSARRRARRPRRRGGHAKREEPGRREAASARTRRPSARPRRQSAAPGASGDSGDQHGAVNATASAIRAARERARGCSFEAAATVGWVASEAAVSARGGQAGACGGQYALSASDVAVRNRRRSADPCSGARWFPVFTGLSAVSLIRMSWNRPGADQRLARARAHGVADEQGRGRAAAEDAALADDVGRQAAVRRVDEELPVRVRAAADLEVAERDPLAAHRLDPVLVGARGRGRSSGCSRRRSSGRGRRARAR